LTNLAVNEKEIEEGEMVCGEFIIQQKEKRKKRKVCVTSLSETIPRSTTVPPA
jgi:hypothetical protein